MNDNQGVLEMVSIRPAKVTNREITLKRHENDNFPLWFNDLMGCLPPKASSFDNLIKVREDVWVTEAESLNTHVAGFSQKLYLAPIPGREYTLVRYAGNSADSCAVFITQVLANRLCFLKIRYGGAHRAGEPQKNVLAAMNLLAHLERKEFSDLKIELGCNMEKGIRVKLRRLSEKGELFEGEVQGFLKFSQENFLESIEELIAKLRESSSGVPYPYVQLKGTHLLMTLKEDENILGRNPRWNPFDSIYLSRKHALIRKENGRYFISDLGSTNGTTLNGVQIPKGQLQELHRGDHINCAGLVFIFCP